MSDSEIKKTVRDGYAEIAKGSTQCCCGPGSCSSSGDISKTVGYSDSDCQAVPEGANLGLGCGNPVALASLKPRDTVLDLGCGGGFDCFLAAKIVGDRGRVIGVDMTPEMIELARQNAAKDDYENVEFKLGDIENLPIADNSVDVIISNCVINLSPDKMRVFREAFRVLRPGGRLMVSDIVLLRELPNIVRDSIAAYIGCISGAMMKDRYLGTIESAGFSDIRVVGDTPFPVADTCRDFVKYTETIGSKALEAAAVEVEGSVRSVRVHAVKPNGVM